MSTTEGVSAAALEAAIIEKLKATHVELKDTSGGGGGHLADYFLLIEEC